MSDRYEPASFEAKWRERWKQDDLFKTREEPGRPKFYGMDFFPYPSGAGLSVGHCRNYVPTDVICRMKYMQGFNVLHPMGFDAFGLPAENEAIKRKRHPSEMIAEYTATYHRQMDLIGISYDWSRSFASSDPGYYKWTEWCFELMYKRGLAYQKAAAVNWDPVDKTVLADEEIIGGRAERSGALVEKKWIPQWFFKITDYAQQLLDDLEGLDWSEGIKAQQRNWIGRSDGVRFSMSIVFEAPAPEAKAAVEIAEAETTPKTPLQELEAEVRAGLHEPTPKSDAELKALEHLYKIGSLIHDSNKTKMEAEDAYSTASAKIQARSGEIKFPQELGLNFEVFTTRIDTVYGMTFCVLAPEHPLVLEIEKFVSDERREAIRNYQAEAKLLSDVDRTATNREKTGVFTGAYAVNPFNEERVPIWLADYVLATYGTGAIMAVPGHDERDFEFAQKFELPVRKVIQHPDETPESKPEDFPLPFAVKDGKMVNSGPYTGYTVQEGQTKLGEWLEERGLGKRVIQYKLRDWLISRQRYWGCPIPILHKADGEMVPVPEEDLPVLLPPVENYEPTDDGKSPLSRIPEFLNTTTPDGMPANRETDTMGGFACSSWYFLRFADPFNENQAWNPEKADYWMPVDCYVGGAEHAVMHLLYARFWTKVFYDAGLVKVREPFARLENQGQVLGLTPYRKPREGERLEVGEEGILVSKEEAAKLPADQVMWRWVRMSKSKGNVVTPDEAVEEYGADALRMFLLFVAPFSADVEWDNRGMEGTSRFLSRVFKLVDENKGHYDPDWRHKITAAEPDQHSKNVRRATHGTIKKSTEDIEKFAFNTYVSELMKYVNTLNDVIKAAGPSRSESLTLALSEAVETLVLLLSPAAPHSADELWESLGKTGFTYHAKWPAYEPGLAVAETETIAVQVNGKLRDTIEIAAGSSEEETVAAAKGSTKVQGYLEGVTIRKTVYVKGRLVNFVVG